MYHTAVFVRASIILLLSTVNAQIQYHQGVYIMALTYVGTPFTRLPAVNTNQSDRSGYSDIESAAQETNKCDSGWTVLNSSCYLISLEPMNWATAQTHCQEKGADLLFLNDEAELLQIRKTMRSLHNEASWWVELRKTTPPNSTWKWLDASSTSTSDVIRWDKNEPSSPDSGRDCAVMDYTGLLSDVPCSSLFPYICKMPKPDFCEFRVYGVCYMDSTQTMSSWDAQENCRKESGILLTISSLNEQNEILRWLKAKSKRWWVGLKRSPLGSNTWKWLDSATNFSSHVTPWERNEPNNQNGLEDCAEIFPRGELNDVPCTEFFGFICEQFSAGNRCRTDWFLFDRGCYKLFTSKMSWDSAQKRCQEYRANLLSINSFKELERIKTEIKMMTERWWVGLNRASPTHSISLVSQWKKGDSDGVLGKEDCVAMDSDGLLSEVPCNSSRYYICVKQSTGGYNYCETGWFLISQVCYSLSTKIMPLSDAVNSCQAKGGNLQFINSSQHLMKMKEMINLKNSWWVGMRMASPDNGLWDMVAGTKKCGMIVSDGSLNYEDCTALHPMICERNLSK